LTHDKPQGLVTPSDTQVCNEELVMHALKDFFSTDYGLMSAVVIAITLGMGVFYARFITKHMREDAEAAARAGKS
jgi:predicted RND superfamily exporter protein